MRDELIINQLYNLNKNTIKIIESLRNNTSSGESYILLQEAYHLVNNQSSKLLVWVINGNYSPNSYNIKEVIERINQAIIVAKKGCETERFAGIEEEVTSLLVAYELTS